MVLPSTGLGALIETPATVREGGHAIAASVSGGGPFEIMGEAASASSYALAYSHGLSESTDLTISPIVQYFGDGTEHVVDFRPRDAVGFGGDARYKFRPFDTPQLAFYVGAGALTNPRADLASASAGVSWGYAFERLHPFVNAHVYAAVPFAARDIVIKDGDTLHPSETIGAIGTTGLAFDFTPNLQLRWAALGVGYLSSRTHHATVLTGGLSVHYTL